MGSNTHLADLWEANGIRFHREDIFLALKLALPLHQPAAVPVAWPILLGRAINLETLERDLGLLQIRSAFLEFRNVDFRALIQTGVLNGRGGWNCNRFCQP